MLRVSVVGSITIPRASALIDAPPSPDIAAAQRRGSCDGWSPSGRNASSKILASARDACRARMAGHWLAIFQAI